MKRIINYVINEPNVIRAFFFIAILDVLAVFLIGYLSVALTSSDYIVIITIILLITTTVLLLKNIKLAVYLLIIIFPFNNFTFFIKISSFKFDWLRITPLDIFMISWIICLFLHNCVFKSRAIFNKNKLSALYLLLLLLIAFSISSVIWSSHKIMSINFIFRLLQNFFIYLLIVALLKSEQDIIRAIKALIASSVITALGMLISTLPLVYIFKEYTIANGLILEFSFKTFQIRASGFIQHNFGVLLLSIGILFAVGLLSQSKNKKNKILLVIVILFLILTAFYSTVRAPVVSLLITIIFLLFAMKNFRAYFFRNLSVFVVCLIFLFSIFTVTHSYIIDFATNYLGKATKQSEHALNDRLSMWKKATNAIIDNDAYLFGLGAGAGTYCVDPEAYVHNVILSIFIDFGFIGLIIFFILISISIMKIYVALLQLKEGVPKAMLLSTSGCIVTLSMATFVDCDYNLNILWYVAGISAAIYRQAISSEYMKISSPYNEITLNRA